MRARLALALVGLVACGDDAAAGDASADVAPPDAGEPPDAGPADAARDVELPELPEPEACDETALAEPRAFPPCGLGAGIFGRWVRDAYGLPAYAYLADERHDPRARYPNTVDPERRDHWHALGNDRVTAMAHNEGYVELVAHERGVTFVNRFDPAHGGFAGGFSYVAEDARVWATAHRFLPEEATSERLFGLGYFQHASEHDGIRVTRRVWAPAGDWPLLLADVVVENRSARARRLRHHEAWDAGRFQVTFEPLVAGLLGRAADDRRRALDAELLQSVTWDAATHTLRAAMRPVPGTTRPPPGEPSPIDRYPPDVVLVALVGDVSAIEGDQERFFGDGGLDAPRGAAELSSGGELSPRSAEGQPACLVMGSDLELASGASAHLRFAFGYARDGAALPLDPSWSDPSRDVLRDSLEAWRARLAYFATERDPVLHREVAWRSFSLQAASTVSDYHALHVVPQGSAYLYRQGLDGAARDHALFALPLVYLDPGRAREQLELVLRTTRAADGAISYAHHGHGVLEDAIIHARPSDLDLHLFLGVAEYLAATGDRAWLERSVPFYPPGATPPFGLGDTVLDHLRAAFRHLRDDVGRGEHGLVRVGTGDWDDGIVSRVGLGGREASVANGESHANTALGVAVLPVLAGLVEPADPELASSLRGYATELRAALEPEWNGRWYRRAYLRAAAGERVVVGDPELELLPQVWALVAGLPGDVATGSLLDTIDATLDAPSPIGAALSEGGAVWPAVSGLLTWAYALHRPELAWRSVVRNTFAAHAEAYPEIWYGIWSGPDGINGVAEELPGWTWSSSTPMRDYPVANMNQEAMGLLGVLRVAGVAPAEDGLRVAPVVPGVRFVLDWPAFLLERDGAVLRGELRTGLDGDTTLHVALDGRVVERATLAGEPVVVAPGSTEVALPLSVRGGAPVRWEVVFR